MSYFQPIVPSVNNQHGLILIPGVVKSIFTGVMQAYCYCYYESLSFQLTQADHVNIWHKKKLFLFHLGGQSKNTPLAFYYASQLGKPQSSQVLPT